VAFSTSSTHAPSADSLTEAKFDPPAIIRDVTKVAGGEAVDPLALDDRRQPRGETDGVEEQVSEVPP
jgi:hypothetical protein